MPKFLCIFLFAGFISCKTMNPVRWPQRESELAGSGFYRQAASMSWASRDSFVIAETLKGNIPAFLKQFSKVSVSLFDSISNKKTAAVFYVAPDYFSIGTNEDWARVCITPMAAQQIADSLHCFLPTRKMVNEIYNAAAVILEPVPMYAYRDSTPTMWQHHLIIEGQRKGRGGLIGGIKKDVVISEAVAEHKKPHRVAIYGWHKPDGQPIQPLYAGHVNWYVDYSHGVRLVYRKVKVGGKWVDYTVLLKDKKMQGLLCDETGCGFLRY